MNRRKAFFFFLISLGICSLFAFFLPFPDNIVSNYQKTYVDARILKYGETGKILKNLNLILPIENKRYAEGPEANPLEVAKRAIKDHRKWVNINKYKKYKKKGDFCYLEVEFEGPEVPFFVLAKKEGEWGTELSTAIRKNRKIVPFFLDLSGPDIPLQFVIVNKNDLFTIHNIAFLQDGYHPIIYSDSISFSRTLSAVKKDMYELKSSLIVFQPHEKPKHLKFELQFQKSGMTGMSKFLKKQGSSHIKMTSRSQHPLILKKEKENDNLAEMSKGKLPIISINVQKNDLYSDKYGILKNFDEHGRDWERLCYVQYFREGEQVITGFSGLRLQGGDPGRKKGLINFRLFFRKEYGQSRVEGSKIFDRPMGDIKRLAIKQSEWEKWPLNSPLAYDISHKIGAWAPPTEPVIFYLNGEKLGLYYVVPHLGERQIEEMLPAGDYQYYRWRGTQHKADLLFFWDQFWMKFKNIEKLTKEYAEQFFDLDNLTNQIFSYLYNGTEDYCQGVAVKDTAERSKMFWLSWDMDHSFADISIEFRKKKDIKREKWEQPPSIATFFTPETNKSKHYCPRVHLFRRLVNDDPVFREQVRDVFMEIMNHRVSDETVSELLYEAWSDLTKANYIYRDEYIGTLSDFFHHRKLVLIKQMEQVLPTAPVKTCRVDADHYPISVDGYTKMKRYNGYYFPGSVLSLEADTHST
ncbi:CotH kinase family protein, partial [bacterium]|nr:CotH kinase family protein [bacterium]